MLLTAPLIKDGSKPTLALRELSLVHLASPDIESELALQLVVGDLRMCQIAKLEIPFVLLRMVGNKLPLACFVPMIAPVVKPVSILASVMPTECGEVLSSHARLPPLALIWFKMVKKPQSTVVDLIALRAPTAKPSCAVLTELAWKETRPTVHALEAGLERAAMWHPPILAQM